MLSQAARQLALQLLVQLARAALAPRLQQLVARRHLDDDAHVSACAHGDGDERELHVEDREEALVETEPVVLFVLAPLYELAHEVHALLLAHGAHAKQVADVDDAEPADLEVMLGERRNDPERRSSRG